MTSVIYGLNLETALERARDNLVAGNIVTIQPDTHAAFGKVYRVLVSYPHITDCPKSGDTHWSEYEGPAD